ncbi:mannose-1-phosphate guanylyltransferase/mannose-6-phosphate isomerase [Pyruvatibacter mobilis]|uniref:mannose-1-phosphate guanylyltransferase n=1 Tax=Pyruvatibacter mobilis TaxID=1712261 RepID=A0A845Q955_9HYPH|nr:mannose-1-phosphate guanylyltransferase/mannose-6-phosphate isomerase [Pyruvatibacter mobilis]NBG94656.1 mannose-1-phosphate guanylyltransferase/mannose-6-phosphate isomerase [Pyruvatibacter mobilis]QJD74164.1 mannose-1-phosphate guanylyltransferase/mannose-6-phosphate isomerase [Pyruvatibacter mobilis]GGD04691.1 mannose-1-phosphate guanyltransferase [Pyruvatibacter mobilis]
MKAIRPIILSGGAGTRLWPTSRALHPKQFMPLTSERTMIQETALRVSDSERFLPPVVVCNEEHRFTVASELQQVGISPEVEVLEPVGRNTAPAIAAAAALCAAHDPEELLLVLPADHHIARPDLFLDVIAQGAGLAEEGKLVTFGIVPDAPETGFGYIRAGEAAGEGGFAVDAFVEKPDADTARDYLDAGGYFWNAGIFLFRADRMIRELEALAPDIWRHAARAVTTGRLDLDFLRLSAEAFELCPSDSIDYAVMEHTKDAVVVPADIGWSDVGSWTALWDIGDKDAHGNVVSGDAVMQETQNTFIRAESRLVATIGVDDLIVVETSDAVLVARRDKVQDVKAVVARLKAEGRAEHEVHARVHRPWGFYEGLDTGERHQVKHLMIKPGAAISLQMHHHRAEHWVVVNGTARVTVGDDTRLLSENESVYIPIGATHRLENPGKMPLSIIEVQSGSYLGEDDIVRFDDVYGRVREVQAAE